MTDTEQSAKNSGLPSHGVLKPDPRAWVNTFGMFSGDELMKEINALGAEWRREQAAREKAENDS